tara:strand:- start:744 stop:860 length:117 start_codon:yes stop_codon:yes gene_type:complete
MLCFLLLPRAAFDVRLDLIAPGLATISGNVIIETNING